jgi:hypothetical protein
MDTSDVLEQTLASARRYRERYKKDPAIASIINQLTYLTDLRSGRRSDWDRLKDLTLGILAVREIEPLDPALADLIYDVSEEVSHWHR